VGELGPIIAMSLVLSQQYSSWQEIGLLLLFLIVVLTMAAIGVGLRPPRLIAFLQRTMHASSQLPVRLVMVVLAGYFVLSDEFGFENILGAFAAGMVVGLATRDHQGAALRHKIDAIFFGWFIPFFFIGAGVKFDLAAITGNMTTALLVPVIVLLLLLVRGLPVLLYGTQLKPAERLPFALFSSVASLSLVVVITDIGVQTNHIGTEVAAALVGAAVLSVLIFPTVGGLLLARNAAHADAGPDRAA
jgi:Kef-type K+ transport system membrane component KefB